jgi:dUTP pyrophosphatase
MSRPRPSPTAIKVNIRRLPHAEGLPLPAYQTAEAAGFDLVAAVPAKSPATLAPGERALIPTGLIFELPSGSEAQVRPRSGLAVKFGITVLNSPGTIDSDYRGEVSVLLMNHGKEPFTINRGERIAQMIVAPVTHVSLHEVAKLTATKRGAGGFGSTGTATPSLPAKAKTRKVANSRPSKQSQSPRKRGARSR